MLAEITKESLLNALQYVSRAASANHPIPLLSGIHLQVAADGFILRSNNTSLSVEYRIPLHSTGMNVRRTGSIVVPARYFNEMIRKLQPGMMTLETAEPFILSIRSGASQCRLCGMDAADFPSMNRLDEAADDKLRMNNGVLKSIIKQVAVAASASESRPVLTGVWFAQGEASLQFVATDGIRLASRTLPSARRAVPRSPVTVPSRNLYEISKMLNDEEGTVEIEVNGRQMRISTGELRIQSALLEGAYPSVHHLIPRSYLSEVTVETARLVQAAERVAVFTSESIVRLEAIGERLVFTSRTAEIGEVQDEVPVRESNGEPFTLSLNGKYLVEILRCLEGERVTLRYSGQRSPLVILPAADPSSALYLITPVRTAN
ncbi:DNA polymerase III subunit beta [Cohnella nanjingensis]|uniref:Beta sliding clamp n=1 Tax=Cohnella nanjingensis TaxID=1387779 RepID=A0A7X0RTB3_9BACL|nr:DNA polymerase III subunit beta [Cohnella nanjingensis]MBB6672015.1 DNA polymerase III subunit beta [Cohnella nanjingensis]